MTRQIISKTTMPSHCATAEEPVLKDRVWIEQQWEAARFRLGTDVRQEKGILFLDEGSKNFRMVGDRKAPIVGEEGLPYAWTKDHPL